MPDLTPEVQQLGTFAGSVVAAGPMTCRAKCTCRWLGEERALGKMAMADLLAHMQDVHGG